MKNTWMPAGKLLLHGIKRKSSVLESTKIIEKSEAWEQMYGFSIRQLTKDIEGENLSWHMHGVLVLLLIS